MKINNRTSDVYGIGHDLPRYCFMWLPIRNDIAFLVISIFALFVTGCGESKVTSPSKPPDEILVEETEAEKIAKEQRMREYEEEKSKLESNLKKMTDNKAQSILQGCKAAVLQLAKSQNKSPFDVFLVDEYSADVYQGAAYAEGGRVSIESEEDRLKRFLKARKNGKKDLRYALNLSYTVMFTHDSFSGPRKEAKGYSCELKPDLSVDPY